MGPFYSTCKSLYELLRGLGRRNVSYSLSPFATDASFHCLSYYSINQPLIVSTSHTILLILLFCRPECLQAWYDPILLKVLLNLSHSTKCDLVLFPHHVLALFVK